MSFDVTTADIPVISEESSREELMRYIRILEDRLEISHVYRVDPATDASGDSFPDRFVAEYLPQAERVAMLRSGLDGIGIRDLTEKLQREDWKADREEEAVARRDLEVRLRENAARLDGPEGDAETARNLTEAADVLREILAP